MARASTFSLGRLLGLIVLPGILLASDSRASATDDDAHFQTYTQEFLDGYLAVRPEVGTTLGLHQYDGKFPDTSRRALSSELQRLKRAQAKLSQFHPETLEKENAVDLRLLRQATDAELFTFGEVRPFSVNPITYARLLDVSIYIKRSFAPLPDRIGSIIAIENQAANLFAQARKNLDPILARPLIQVAIQAADGTADFLSKEVVEALATAKTNSPELFARFEKANSSACAAARSYARWLEKERLPRAREDFAWGRARYRRMLHCTEMIDVSPEDLLAIGLRELAREQAVFTEAARSIDPNLPPIEVFKLIQHDHPTAESLLPDARKNLESIRSFLINHDIISMPSEVRVRVEETPQYDRASSFASMDTPGPFETKASEAYYYVTPTEASWTEKQKDEWLTAFNYYTTDVVSIHEAYPGHYTQFLHLNASKATRVEKIFNSYAFVEGWAHYSEQMLLDEGFGRDGGDLRAAKYRLAQSDEALLRLCRLCVSIKMHCQGMSLEDGARFFHENCYYETKPAHQEALRGTFDPGYLFYTVGKMEILKLRDDWRRQEGAAYNLKRFHEELLSHGAPPILLLREQLLKDASTWGQIL